MKTVLIIIAFLCSSCSLNTNINTPKPSNKLKLANEIRLKVAKKLQEKYELKPCGSGGQMMHEIKMLALSFDYFKPVDIKLGRKLLVAAVNEFKDAINQDEKIRPYLSNYPFESKNIQIQIFIKRPNGSRCENDELCVISAIDNILEYETREKKSIRLEIIHKETYEEAIKRIHSGTNIK